MLDGQLIAGASVSLTVMVCGLAASVWTPDIAAADAIARRLEAGTVWINTIFDLDPASPFGGVKESGFGLENGQWGLDEFTTFKVIRRAA